VESSALVSGYPVEVALCDDALNVSNWLVRPHERWAGLNWNDEAQAIHGLSQAYLQAEGMPAEQVAAEIAGRLKDVRFIWSDNPAYDAHWLGHLVALHPASVWDGLLIYHESEALTLALGEAPAAAAWASRSADVVELVRATFPHVHRAEPDSLSLASRFRLLADEGYFEQLKTFVGSWVARAL
jgi:hypothetical protein